MMILAEILKNGNLKLSLDDAENDSAELQEMSSEKDTVSILCEGMEHYSCNGSYTPFDAGQGNPFVGLTNAPCIAESLDYDDEGTATIEGKLWYYADYQFTDPIQEILERGFVIFAHA